MDQMRQLLEYLKEQGKIHSYSIHQDGDRVRVGIQPNPTPDYLFFDGEVSYQTVSHAYVMD